MGPTDSLHQKHPTCTGSVWSTGSTTVTRPEPHLILVVSRVPPVHRALAEGTRPSTKSPRLGGRCVKRASGAPSLQPRLREP